MIKDTLGERVSDVRASQRLTTSASCLVAGGDGRDRAAGAIAGAAESRRRHQADPRDQHAPSSGRGDCRAKDAAADLSFLLLEQAQILDGELPEDPAAFANRLNQLVLRGIAKETG